MALLVHTSWGYEATHRSAEDWDIDRDHDLSLYNKPVSEQGAEIIVVYASGQWLRVMRPDDPPPETSG